MKLLLAMPAPWTETVTSKGTTWTRPDASVRVELGPLIPLPEDRKGWGETVIYAAVPPGGAVRQVDIVDTKTKRGWPATVVSLAYRDAAQQGAEFRVVMFLEILYYGATVSCVVPKEEIARWESEWREAIIPLLQDVDVDLTPDAPAHLADVLN